jgi:hypothetical protein
MTGDGGRTAEDGGQTAMSERISTFKELQVYQLACVLDEAIFNETKHWPSDEKFALIDRLALWGPCARR